MVGPIASLAPLARADGSASYTCPTTGFSILGAVNAPVELPGRRDALKPEEATLEVFVKPGTFPAGVGERYVEGVIRTMLGRLILGREKGYPRRGIVLTLTVVAGEEAGMTGRGDSYVPVLPALLHTSLLALLCAAVPMSMTFTATALAVTPSGEIRRDPSVQEAKAAKSVHAIAFSSKGHLLLNESDGASDFETWERVHDRAVAICRGASKTTQTDGDIAMAEDGPSLESFIRETVSDQIWRDYTWKIGFA